MKKTKYKNWCVLLLLMIGLGSILHDLCLYGLWRNTCRKAMGLNRMGHGIELVRGKASLSQRSDCFFCRHARSLCPLRMVFGQIHTVMPQAGSVQHFGICFGVVLQQGLGSGPDTGEMGGVVGGVS